jgi:hypothetical protein
MAKKGLILSNFQIIGPRAITDGKPDIKKYLLYCDKFDVPYNNLIGSPISPDEEFLSNEGLLTQTGVNIEGGTEVSIVLATQKIAFDLYEKSEPGEWSLCFESTDNSFLLDEAYYSESIGINILFKNCLPVPQSDVSLDDILRFKRKRKDELIHFREGMGELIAQIKKAEDLTSESNRVKHLITSSIRDLNTVAKESFVTRLLDNLSVAISVPAIIACAYTGAQIISPPGLGAFIGAAVSCVRIEMRQLPKPTGLTSNRPFAYLYHAQDEGIIR